MKKLPEYLAIFDEEYEGVFAISLVDKPANEVDFVRLSKTEEVIQLSIVDDEKRLVTGVVLIPDQKILRYNEETKEHYYLIFKEEDILKFSREFIKKGYQSNSTENHDYNKQIENLTFVETWIVKDPKNDKANALGFNVPAGTWMISGYVEDDNILAKIKDNQLKGFSIDGILKKVKNIVNMSENTNDLKLKDNNMSFLKKIITLMAGETDLLKEITTEDYGVITADNLNLGTIVYGSDMSPLTNAEFEFEGWIYKTDDSGAIVESVEKEVEEEVEASVEEVEVESEIETSLAEVVMENGDVYTSDSFSVGEELFLNGELYVSQTTVIEGRTITTDESGVIISNEEINEEMEKLKSTIQSLESEKLSMLQLTEELRSQIETLSKLPAEPKLNTNENKDYKPSSIDIFNRIANGRK